ncbi:MAG: tyrosine-type recombinase/integrase [Pseudomonadota bacterium]
MTISRTPSKKKAKQLIKLLRPEHPDYDYLREVFRHIRQELAVKRKNKPKHLPYVPTEEEIKQYYESVWRSKNMNHMILIKTLLYTGMRVSEVIDVKLNDVDLDRCQIRIERGKGDKTRMVPFPASFKETLAMHIQDSLQKGATHLFESSWKKKYSDRGVRRILSEYTKQAGIARSISPHKLRHFLLTWLKKQGIDDALIQPYSGHESRKSLEIYSQLSIGEAQKEYNKVIEKFPV